MSAGGEDLFGSTYPVSAGGEDLLGSTYPVSAGGEDLLGEDSTSRNLTNN